MKLGPSGKILRVECRRPGMTNLTRNKVYEVVAFRTHDTPRYGVTHLLVNGHWYRSWRFDDVTPNMPDDPELGYFL